MQEIFIWVGNYFHGNYDDPFISKYTNKGELGTCGFTPENQNIIDVDIQTVSLTFSPLTKSFQPITIPIAFIPDANRLEVSEIVCSSAPQCHFIDITGPDNLASSTRITGLR